MSDDCENLFTFPITSQILFRSSLYRGFELVKQMTVNLERA